MLAIAGDIGPHWGTASLSILTPSRISVEAGGGFYWPPNGVLSRLRSFEGYCSSWEAFRSSQRLVIVNDS